MHELASGNVDSSRHWWALAIVVAAQLMFAGDAFIVNVVIPNTAVDPRTLRALDRRIRRISVMDAACAK